MTTVLNLIMLPLRAPMVLLLLLVSTYLGLHWSRPGSWADAGLGDATGLIWSAECLQALVVVVVCTMPELLLRRVSSIMAASRVASLVVTLLVVVTGGLYLLHLDVLSNVLILSSSVLLARLDLVRLRVVPPPFVMTLILSVLVLGGISLGRTLEVQLRPYVSVHQESRVPPSTRHREPQAGAPFRSMQGQAPAEPETAEGRDRQASDGATATARTEPRPTSTAGRSGSAERVQQPAATSNAGHSNARVHGARQPDRAIPHLQENPGEFEAP